MSEIIELVTRETVVIETPSSSEVLVVESDVEVEVVEVAEQGAPGRDGLAGNASHVHDQMTPSDVWVINHPLDKYPSVTCMDSAGDEIDGLLSYASRAQLTMTFAAATGGKAYLN